ncbi:hypothetical protein [Ferrovum myxofaciens]|uniref:hypothetical protein n=1 Tax=Ferrovum myxofaciens TaxID=416213 RepID=UPI00235577D7|nr:hypothetical protein [Ferrovum myxofaciens]
MKNAINDVWRSSMAFNFFNTVNALQNFLTPTQLFPRPANPHEYRLSLYGTSNLPSYLPSKNKRFDWRGRCTRLVRRLLFHINHQLSRGLWKPIGVIASYVFPLKDKYKATISHYQTLYIERIPTHETQGQRNACANNSLLGAAHGDFHD